MPNMVPRGKAHGVQYVVGTPAQTPVLRPLRQPIYDSEIYPAAGVRELQVFVNNVTFAAGGAKNEADTNLTQGGSLGTPLEFDLVGFTMEFVRAEDMLADHNVLYNNGVFIWVFGQNTIWLQVRDTRIPEGITQSGSTAVAGASILGNGWGVVTNFYNFTTPDRKARRITSNESFRARKLWPDAPAVSADRRFTIYMLGVLYGQL